MILAPFVDRANRPIQHYFADGRVWRPETDWAGYGRDRDGGVSKLRTMICTISAWSCALRHLKRMGLLVRADESAAVVEEEDSPRFRREVGEDDLRAVGFHLSLLNLCQFVAISMPWPF